MGSSIPNPCLLEGGQLPIRELAEFAVREGRRPRAIYTGHKWFARRLGSVFRALLIGATSRPNSDFWDRFYGDANLRHIVVLDPFVGGGTSIVEALRLGATIHAVDVDPVACVVSRFAVNADKMTDLSEALCGLQRTVGDKVRQYHLTTDTDGAERVVLHHFWIQVVPCEGCGHSFEAHPNFILGEDGKHRWVVCSGCGEVHRRRISHERFRCGTCGVQTRVAEGNVVYGAGRCPRCGARQPLIGLGRDSGSPPIWRLFALEILDELDGGRPVPIARRRFVKASESDIALFESAVTQLRTRLRTHGESLPEKAIINRQRTDSRLLDYGYREWTELFNSRQLLHLSLLAEAIDDYDGAVREGLSIAFSDHLTTNCMMAGYTSAWRRLTPLFSVRAFRHVQRPVEINPWCDGTGRGTFPNTVRKVMRAARFASNPKELSIGGGFRRAVPQDPIAPPNVVCGTARDLGFLADGTVDLVLTDPPYLDNIVYSELAEFFVPWLELLKIVNDPKARERISTESLIGSRHDVASIEQYSEGLGSAFAEIGRVLKTNGMLVFSFRHTSPEAWLALALGLEGSGLRVVSFLPVPGEAGIGPHYHAGTGLWDAVFVLRHNRRTPVRKDLRLSVTQIEDVKQCVSQWTETLQDASIPFAGADQLALFRAGLVATALGTPSNDDAAVSVPLDEALSVPVRKRLEECRSSAS